MAKVSRSRKRRSGGSGSVEAKGARRASEASTTAGSDDGPLEPGQRWTAARKREVVLRILGGESMDKLSRELGVEIYRLSEWRDRALAGIDAGLKSRRTDPVQVELDAAMKRLGELTMENELLYERCRRSKVGFPKGRSRK